MRKKSDFLKAPPEDQAFMVDTAFKNIGKLFSERVLNNPHHALFEAVVTYLLINLSDLLEFSAAQGHPVTFEDDVQQSDYIKNVSDLIKHCRNAACHLDTARNRFDAAYGAFNVIVGQRGRMVIDGYTLECDFDDDAAIFFGATRVYQGRHILRSLRAAFDFHSKRMPERAPEWRDWLGVDQMGSFANP